MCFPLVLCPQKSKKCPITIKKGLGPSRSNATGIVWKPADTVATATYFVRAFVMHNSSSTVSYPVATGASMGYFQVCPARLLFLTFVLLLKAACGRPRRRTKVHKCAQAMNLLCIEAPTAVQLVFCNEFSAFLWPFECSARRCRCSGPPKFYENSSSIASFAPVQVQGIDPRTTGMKIAAGICSCVGPLMFLGYFLFGYLRKKNV